jgi:ribosomal protein S19E (S16A)
MRGKVGVKTLRKHYSSKQRVGTCTEHTRLSTGKVIRYCLQELEKAQLVGKMMEEEFCTGKVLTKKGITDMDRIAAQLAKDSKKRS